jgi:hypothetical protein
VGGVAAEVSAGGVASGVVAGACSVKFPKVPDVFTIVSIKELRGLVTKLWIFFHIQFYLLVFGFSFAFSFAASADIFDAIIFASPCIWCPIVRPSTCIASP